MAAVTGSGLRIVTFKVDPPTLEALDRLASTLRVSRSDLIREAIERLLDEYGVRVERRPPEPRGAEDLVTIEITL
ncbi:MAG: ribbon-helix-helix protein, CopG family [Desulfurococcales archaeon]|nr:ribbon-helix-helix protein, CopG family [Desulfurococcales archaeon]